MVRPWHCALSDGCAVGVDSVVVRTVQQTRTSDPVRGRVNAAARMVSYGTIALGAAAGGAVGQWIGVRTALLIGCIGALSGAIWVAWLALSLRRHGESMDGGAQPSVTEPDVA